jgi:hypothetical protein
MPSACDRQAQRALLNVARRCWSDLSSSRNGDRPATGFSTHRLTPFRMPACSIEVTATAAFPP